MKKNVCCMLIAFSIISVLSGCGQSEYPTYYSEEYENGMQYMSSPTPIPTQQPSKQLEKINMSVVPDKLGEFSEGLAAFCYNDKWGYLNDNGEVVIDAVYDSAYPFYNTVAMVTKDDVAYGIDKNNNIKFEIDYIQTSWKDILHGGNDYADLSFKYGYVAAKSKADVDEPNKIVLTVFDTLGNEQHCLADLVIEAGSIAEERLRGTDNNMFVFYAGKGKMRYLNESLKPIFDFDLVPGKSDEYGFRNGYAPISNNDGKWGMIDTSGNIVFDYIYDGVRFYEDGLVPICKYGKWGYADKDGNMVIDYQYIVANSFKNGLAGVKSDTFTGYIDTKGNVKIDLSNKNISYNKDYWLLQLDDFDKNDLALIYKDMGNSVQGEVIDKNGNVLLNNGHRCGENVFYVSGNPTNYYKLK